VSARYGRLLDQITRVRGVRGALLVAGEDGIVVAESLLEGIRGNAVAALMGSLARRIRRAADSIGVGAPEFVHLQATGAALCAVPAPEGMLLVAIADAEVNVGLLRLTLRKASEVIA
jgi:predicted regulator of Ras-like GTPase activity (Roadblock/LC7/MglB family)